MSKSRLIVVVAAQEVGTSTPPHYHSITIKLITSRVRTFAIHINKEQESSLVNGQCSGTGGAGMCGWMPRR